MKTEGRVVDIFSARVGESGLPRPKVDSLNLIKDYGIEFDKFAGKELEQSVMIVGLKSYEIAKENDIELPYGSFGENILFDFDPHELKIGDIIEINDAKIKITQKCTLCSHLSVFHKHLPKIIKNHRGIYCKIIESGKVKKDDKTLFLSKSL